MFGTQPSIERAIAPASDLDRDIDLVPDDWGPKSYSEIADLALTRRGPDEINFEVRSHFLLVLLTPQPKREIQLGGTRQITFDAPAGSVEIIPAGVSFKGRWGVPKENILISLDPKRLETFAAREFDSGQLEMRPVQPGLVDKAAIRIASLMRDELLHPGAPSRLYMESLSSALLLQMVRGHSSLAEQPVRGAFRGGLSTRAWRDIEDYMRANLATDMSLSELAARAGLSYSHFLRAFRQSSGISPHRYIMLLRAHHAKELAATTTVPLKQVALRCGFSSQSHMTTVMKALLNITPGEIRRWVGASFVEGE